MIEISVDCFVIHVFMPVRVVLQGFAVLHVSNVLVLHHAV